MNVKTMNGKSAVTIQWLPCIEVTLNDEAPCNGWIFVKTDDGHDPVIDGVYEVNSGEWVDEVIPQQHWNKTKLLFVSTVIDPTDFPYAA